MLIILTNVTILILHPHFVRISLNSEILVMLSMYEIKGADKDLTRTV